TFLFKPDKVPLAIIIAATPSFFNLERQCSIQAKLASFWGGIPHFQRGSFSLICLLAKLKGGLVIM
ncbi:20139_t:CDS:1, partial [Gigaspora margarita]